MRDAVLMPVYNEAPTVTEVLEAVRRHFSGEIIVIDDGSDDGTPAVLAEHDDITVVRLDRNCGYGCALRIGFDIAERLGICRLVTMDFDGQHEPAHIPEFLSTLEQGFDIVSGSRYLSANGASGEVPEDRREMNMRITQMVNDTTGWSLTDAFCGFKAYSVAALGKLALTESGYGMPLELWARAWRARLSVTELAVERIYCDRDRSFGTDLDDPEKRLAYYLEVWQRGLEGARNGC